MSESLRCICVDDEPLALEVMQTLLLNHPGLKVERTFGNAIEASFQTHTQTILLMT